MSRVDALMDACHKRARPIVMTTVAMTAGMLPNVLGLHGDDSFRRPMGLVVVGGHITTTILRLPVVPLVSRSSSRFACVSPGVWAGRLRLSTHKAWAPRPRSESNRLPTEAPSALSIKPDLY